jgi:hypothetical protein
MVTLSRGALVLFTFLLFLAGGLFGAGVAVIARPKPDPKAQALAADVLRATATLGIPGAHIAAEAAGSCATCGQRIGGGK